MSAPTEEEIRRLLAERLAKYPRDGGEEHLNEAVDEMFDLIDYCPLNQQEAFDQWPHTAIGDDVWADLRPTEWKRLGDIVHEAKARAYDRARALIIDELVNAALVFAAEYPDAPRARREVPA